MSLTNKLGTEKVSKLLYQMSIPAMVGMLVNSFYNIADTIFIGHGVGHMAIGGLAIAFPIQMLTMGFSQLVGIGAASSVSRSLGANEQERASLVAGNGYMLISIISLTFAIGGLIFTDPLLKIFGATETLLPYARDYTRIILLGSVFFSIKMVAQSLIQAEGQAKIAMYSTMLGGLLNIALDPIFIFIFKMGIKGAAYATIISQFVSFVYVMIYLLSDKSALALKLHHLKLRLDVVKDIFSVGTSAFARTTTNTIFLIVINNSLRLFGGDTAITLFGILNRIIAFLFLPVLGIVQGMQPIAGYNYGAQNFKRVKEVIILAMLATTGIGLIGAIIGLTTPHIIIRAFTSDSDIINNGAAVFRIIVVAAPFMGIQFVGATLFQAIGKPLPATLLSLLRQFILLTPLILILPNIFNLKLMGVWLSFPMADTLALVITLYFIKNEYNKLKNHIQSENPININIKKPKLSA